VIAIQADKKQIGENQPLPIEDAESTPDELRKLRAVYRKQFAQITERRNADQQSLFPAITKKLQDLEVTLTRAGRIDEASEVKAYRLSLGPVSPQEKIRRLSKA